MSSMRRKFWRLPTVGGASSHHDVSGWDFLTKISQLEFSKVADEQVLRFQVSVEDPPAVDVAKSSDQLKQEDLEEQWMSWVE